MRKLSNKLKTAVWRWLRRLVRPEKPKTPEPQQKPKWQYLDEGAELPPVGQLVELGVMNGNVSHPMAYEYALDDQGQWRRENGELLSTLVRPYAWRANAEVRHGAKDADLD